MSDFYDLQVGDEYYYPVGHNPLNPNKWTVSRAPPPSAQGSAYMRREFDGASAHMSILNWENLTSRGNIVTKKYLIDMVGEEELFKHLLSDTLEDLLLQAKTKLREEHKATLRRGIMR